MKRSTRLFRILLDPIIFLVGLIITFAILLDAMGSNILYMFSLISVANSKSGLSEVLSAVIPLALISILTILAAVVRTMHSISQAIRENSLDKIRHMGNDVSFFCVMFFLVCILIVAEMLQILELKNLFRQLGPIADERLYLLKLYVLTTLLFTTLVAIMLSARDVTAADLSHSIEGNRSDG